jgi:hypothetical protein
MENNTYHYLWIDDEQAKAQMAANTMEVLATSMGFNLKITVMYPLSIDNNIKYIQSNKIDGLITDLRLDKTPPIGEIAKGIDYRGSTLVEEIRQRTYENNLPSKPFIIDIPIILISSNNYIEKKISSFKPEFILFDDRIIRDDIAKKESVLKMISYVDAYKAIKKSSTGEDLLILSENNKHWVHQDVLFYLTDIKKQTSYKTAIFVLNELLERTTNLINEAVLAARLGVDIKESGEAWHKLLEKFKPCKYKGIYHLSHPRWWFTRVEEIWLEKNPDIYLEPLKADERVSLLADTFEIQSLVAAKAIGQPFTTDTRFWDICQYHQMPLSLSDAFAIYEERSTKYWQASFYLSKAAALSSQIPDGVILMPQDHEEIDRLQNIWNNNNK